jgi:O-acetyl-ADP-ribose deacetylase (regulator of RNase III)
MTAIERIKIILGDITLIEADAIVNAANTSLLGGGGVDGAIHKAAGDDLLKECRLLNGCNVGEAKVTSAYNLKARYVIHTVGPIWKGGTENEPMLLAMAYRNSLSIAMEKNIDTIAFPAISTGIYGFPAELAAFIAITEISRHLSKERHPSKVILVAYSTEQFNILTRILLES